MLNKNEHTKFWLDSAAEDIETSKVLFAGRRFGFCLFSLHLCIEKTIKALWIKESITNTPPYTHTIY